MVLISQDEQTVDQRGGFAGTVVVLEVVRWHGDGGRLVGLGSDQCVLGEWTWLDDVQERGSSQRLHDGQACRGVDVVIYQEGERVVRYEQFEQDDREDGQVD